jgi:hypothetical protein
VDSKFNQRIGRITLEGLWRSAAQTQRTALLKCFKTVLHLILAGLPGILAVWPILAIHTAVVRLDGPEVAAASAPSRTGRNNKTGASFLVTAEA